MLLSIFGAEPISDKLIPSIGKGMPDLINENVPKLIVYAVPFMLLFTAIEYYMARKEEKELYQDRELMGSIFVGLGYIGSGLLTQLLLFFMVIQVYNLVPWRMELHWWMFFPAYVILDLCSYWAHRISHEQRFWWCTHITHHSGNKYNLAVSFRLSWIQQFKIIFMLPMALLGFHPLIFFVANQMAVLFQFWVHTEYVPKLHPWIEYFIATPSNHRVHHGSQYKYLDKNYGASFIFWDRMFGTYQPEEERAIYGLTTPIPYSANPIYLNFHEVKDIYNDVKQAKGLRRKFFFIFGSPTAVYHYKKAQAKLAEKEVEVAA